MNNVDVSKNKIVLESFKPIVIKTIFFFLKLFLSFLSYSAWAWIIITCVSFILISGINFSKTDLSLASLTGLIPVLRLLGVEEKSIYGSSDLIALFSKISLIFMIIGSVIGFIYQKVTGNKFNISKKTVFFLYLSLISILFIISLISCFFASAEKNAISIISMLVFFWITALGSYIWYLLINFLKNYLNKIESTITIGTNNI